MNRQQFEYVLNELKNEQKEFRPSDVMLLSEPLRSTLNHAIRLGRISLTQFANELEIERGQAAQLAEILLARDFFHNSALTNEEETYYEPRMSALTRPLTRPPSDIWRKIK